MVLLQQVCHCNADTPHLLPARLAYEQANARSHVPPAEWTRLTPEQQASVTLWSRLAEGTRHAVTPYLNLRADMVEAHKYVESPLYAPTSVYSDWVVRWCRQLLSVCANLRDATTTAGHSLLDPTQRSRATLLVAHYAYATARMEFRAWPPTYRVDGQRSLSLRAQVCPLRREPRALAAATRHHFPAAGDTNDSRQKRWCRIWRTKSHARGAHHEPRHRDRRRARACA